jgi:hypothetical protein
MLAVDVRPFGSVHDYYALEVLAIFRLLQDERRSFDSPSLSDLSSARQSGPIGGHSCLMKGESTRVLFAVMHVVVKKCGAK